MSLKTNVLFNKLLCLQDNVMILSASAVVYRLFKVADENGDPRWNWVHDESEGPLDLCYRLNGCKINTQTYWRVQLWHLRRGSYAFNDNFVHLTAINWYLHN